jgi:Leucine-rich repeat (LRR) protein
MIVSTAFLLGACAKEPMPVEEPTQPPVEELTGNITMTTKAAKVNFSVAVTGDCLIDWGDGKKSNLNDATDFDNLTKEFYFSHDYSGTTAHTIVITGNITWLNCRYNGLTALDVSRSTALTDLVCSYNQLTALDVSRNTLLEWLGCETNQLTNLDVRNNAELYILTCGSNPLTVPVINNIIRSLPDRIGKDWWGTMCIDDPQNPEIDSSIAVKKKWGVTRQRY